MIWDILGIKPTKDIKAIKSTYTKLAKQFNPEEYPEEFRKIYDAYKAACRYAKNEVNFINITHSEKNQNAIEILEGAPAYSHECPFDFSSVNDVEQVTEKMPYTVLKAYLLNTIKKYVSDNETKNNCSLWKKFFSSEEFEQFYFESDFRRKASDIIYCETFTPETASVIASGFGRGTRAIPLKSDPLNQWRVDISNCEGKKSPKVEPLVPDYAQSYIYRDMTLKDLIFLIAVLIILMFIAALYSSYHADKAYYRPSQQQTTVVEQSGPPYIYTDELGNLHIADQPPER